MKVNKAFISADGKLALMIDNDVVMVDDSVTQSLKELLTERYYLSKEEKSQRIKQGMAKSNYKPTGKKPNKAKHTRIKELLSYGELSKLQIAKVTDTSLTTIYRIVNELKED